MWRRALVVLVGSIGALVVAGCRTPFTDFAEILRVTEGRDYIRLPVVFIPGIKGTQLVKTEPGRAPTVIWGISGHVAGFRGFNELTLDYEKLSGGSVDSLIEFYKGRSIYPGEVLMAYRLGFTWISFHDFIVYRDVVQLLVDDGDFVVDSPRGRSLFLLPYDWRLDNRVAAVQLALALPQFRKEYERLLLFEHCDGLRRRAGGPPCTDADVGESAIQASFQRYLQRAATRYPELFTRRPGRPPEIKFHIVAHSMGGLIGQYFITRLGGSRDVFNFITLGTPTKGAMDSLKAFAEGEYPDTMLSNVLGVLAFEKRATNFISISFPSAFQLLPRYPRAVTGAVALDQLGLASGPARLSSDELGRAYTVYEKYRITPDLKAVGRALGEGTRGVDERVIRRHFVEQLRSAACFHAALDDEPDPASGAGCEEVKRVGEAVHFLRRVYEDRYRNVVTEDAVRTLEQEYRSPDRPKQFDRRIVYGGHCQVTLTRARFDASHRVHFLYSKPSPGPDGTADGAFYGDGRVPVVSSQFLRPNERWSTSFFLCVDHVGLVKDASFKYNLLRALLTHSEEVRRKAAAATRE